MDAGGKTQNGESAAQLQRFSAGKRRADSAVSRRLKIRHREEILGLFLGNELNAAGMKPLAEAFQHVGRKDNVLLQIEKALLPT
ncbi:MAG: hypothetical protein ABWZ39_10875 [Pseudomonas caspiana]